MQFRLQTLFIMTILIIDIQCLKCYLCIYWDGPGVPSDQNINDITCKKGQIPDSRFAQECDPGNICAFAHIEATPDQCIKSLSVRSCLPMDGKLREKCVRLKTLRDLYQLNPVSRILLYEDDGVISDGYQCGCTTDLCNTSIIIKTSLLKLLCVSSLLYFWIFLNNL